MLKKVVFVSSKQIKVIIHLKASHVGLVISKLLLNIQLVQIGLQSKEEYYVGFLHDVQVFSMCSLMALSP